VRAHELPEKIEPQYPECLGAIAGKYDVYCGGQCPHTALCTLIHMGAWLPRHTEVGEVGNE